MARIMVNRGPQWVQLIKGSDNDAPGIVHLREARRAGRGIGHNPSPHPSRPTLADGEILRRGRPAIGNAGGTVDPAPAAGSGQPGGSKPSSPPTSRTSTPSPSLQTSPQQGLRPGQLARQRGGTPPLHFTANADCTVHALTYQASAVRRRFSIFICSSLLRSTHEGDASGTLPCRPGRSRGGSRDRACWLRLFRHDVQSGAAMADHRATTTSIAPCRRGDDAGFCSRCNAPASHG